MKYLWNRLWRPPNHRDGLIALPFVLFMVGIVIVQVYWFMPRYGETLPAWLWAGVAIANVLGVLANLLPAHWVRAAGLLRLSGCLLALDLLPVATILGLRLWNQVSP